MLGFLLECYTERRECLWRLFQGGCSPLFFMVSPEKTVAHSPIAPVTALAAPLAAELGLEVLEVSFLTHTNPPTLRVDVSSPAGDVGLEDCERLSRALETALDASDAIPAAYILEISSPGIADELTSDRDFVSFKGFPVIVRTEPPYKGKPEWHGRLLKRDAEAVHLNLRGRVVAVPRSTVVCVRFDERPD